MTITPLPTFAHTPITALTDFYVTRAHRQQTRQIEAAHWSLLVDGLVAQPLALQVADLHNAPQTSRTLTMLCAARPFAPSLIATGTWGGVALADIMARAGVRQAARYLHIYAADGYSTCVNVADASAGVLAHQLNDAPLTAEHGFPARVVIPGLYDYKWARWVHRLHFSDMPLVGFWEAHGWDVDGRAAPVAAFTQVQDVGAGRYQLAGYAYGGASALHGAEVRIDGGAWGAAALDGTPAARGVWSHWSLVWQAPAPGQYTIEVRAVAENAAPPSAITQVLVAV
jgi:DMSO/TMAO reductase YedYZ molybdopterin-dependent catalytic subunit